MPDGYVLSAADVELLRRMAADFRNRKPPTSRARYDTPADHEEFLAPETYVAMTPNGGVNALVHKPGQPPRPGYADCAVRRIINEGGIPVLRATGGTVYRVYNLLHTALAGNQLMIVTRDKFGAWWFTGACCGSVEPGTGSGTGSAGFCTEMCPNGLANNLHVTLPGPSTITISRNDPFVQLVTGNSSSKGWNGNSGGTSDMYVLVCQSAQLYRGVWTGFNYIYTGCTPVSFTCTPAFQAVYNCGAGNVTVTL